jgi:capsular polysaccharide biosynthesis protein
VQNTKYLNIIGSQANDKFTLGCKNKFVQNNKKGQYLLLTSIADIAFSHFVFDSFTKLLVLPNKSLLEELKIIVNESIKPYQVSFLTEFGISNENIIKKPYNEDWLCEQLLVIQQPASNNNYITPAYFHMLRNYLLSTYPPDYKKPWPSRVYLDRDDERSQMRAIVNEAELKAIAIKHGFTVLTPGKLSFADKVAMFANADCIIGQYGGGLQFGVTCPPHSKWLVLQSPHFYRHQINLHSALLPMDVLNLTGDAVEAKPKYLNNDPFKVDAQSFEAALVAHFN